MGGSGESINFLKCQAIRIDFACNGAVNQLHSIISNRDINFSARRLLLLSVIRPSREYGSEVWEGNKGQTNALESVVLGGVKKSLGALLKPVMRQ